MKRIALAVFALAALGGIAWAAATTPADPKFTDAQKQTAEFMGYWKTIQLTPQQEGVKREALTALPAPCCSDNSLYTCCCPCNMAKTSWGLANYLIVKKGYGVEQVRAKVSEWVKFINPQGYPGDTCYTGGCNKAFAKAGCGGMAEPVVF
jgi:hypothetical protein